MKLKTSNHNEGFDVFCFWYDKVHQNTIINAPIFPTPFYNHIANLREVY